MNNSNEYTMQKMDILAIIRLNIKKTYFLYEQRCDSPVYALIT